ncbi:MAG TPA: TonB-dependent receptor [Gemmatimonadales bacterium]|nr:TonB-dependent receptor [Gemmatimonadales bacterium]
MRFPFIRRAARITALLLIGSVAPVAAQQGVLHRLHGTVRDSASGSPLAGASVELPSLGRRAVTDAEGHFEFGALPSAPVTLVARLVGFAPIVRSADLSDGDLRLELRLAPRTATLEELTIEADTLSAPRLRDVQSSIRLDQGDLEAMRGQTLGETLEQLPGVAVIQYGPGVAKPVIRGLNSTRILVMNSGVRLEDQQWGAEHAPEIDTFEADAISVVRGTGAVLYGPDALGGVLLVERPPVPSTPGVRGSFAVNFFSNNLQGAFSGSLEGGNLRLPLIGAMGWRVRLTARKAGDARTPDYYLPNTGFQELNGSIALGVARGWGTSELLYSRFSTELGVYSGAHVGNLDDLMRAMETPRTSEEFSYDIGRPDQEVSHDLVRWKTVLALPNAQSVEITAGSQFNWRREYDNNGPLRFRDIPAFDLRLTTASLDARWHHAPIGRMRGTVGATGLYQWNYTNGKGFLIPEYTLGSVAAFAQEELVLGRWAFSGGARFDYVDQHTVAYSDAGIVSPDTRRSWSDVAASLGASYLLGRDWSLALRAARGWRAPNVNERFAQGVHHGSAQYERGDSSLTPERKLGPELSLRHAGRRVQLELSAWTSRIDGFIYLEPTAPVQTIRGAFPGYRYAQTDATMRGLEALASWNATSHVSLVAAGSLVRGTDRATGNALFDLPADRLTLSARYTGGARRAFHQWHVEVGTLLVREQDQVPPNTIYSLPTDGYALFNLEAGLTELHFGGLALDAVLAVRNVFDTRYRDYLSRYRLFVDDPGRDVVVRITLPFGHAPGRAGHLRTH